MRLRELVEEARIILDEEADITDTVFDHCQTVDAHSEGKACDFLRVQEVVLTLIVNCAKDGGVNHSTTCNFDPLWLLAFGAEHNVYLKAGLSEGKEVRAEAYFGIFSEEALVKVCLLYTSPSPRDA